MAHEIDDPISLIRYDDGCQPYRDLAVAIVRDVLAVDLSDPWHRAEALEFVESDTGALWLGWLGIEPAKVAARLRSGAVSRIVRRAGRG